MSSHMFTIAEAATACGISKRTVRRKIENKELEGAFQDAKKMWKIPLEALLGAGYKVNEYDKQDTSKPLIEAPKQSREAELEAEIALLKMELRGKVNEIARLDQALNGYVAAVRVLESGQSKKRWFKKS